MEALYFATGKMSKTLGKRKRQEPRHDAGRRETSDEAAMEEDELDAQEIFRRHFEAQFKPLPIAKKAEPVQEMMEEGSDDDSDWNGISDAEENGVQVVEHTDAQSRMAAMSKEELRSFMVFGPVPTSWLY